MMLQTVGLILIKKKLPRFIKLVRHQDGNRPNALFKVRGEVETGAIFSILQSLNDTARRIASFSRWVLPCNPIAVNVIT